MAAYRRGDVVLARLCIDGRGEAKIRPAVVIEQKGNALLSVLPMTSRQPADTPHTPIELFDYLEGGLDFFETSYVLTASEYMIGTAEVIALKGRLAQEPVETICAAIRNQP
jgi:mRNA-degrading endonuclease toxin of MazEF toxin-antitoxin module